MEDYGFRKVPDGEWNNYGKVVKCKPGSKSLFEGEPIKMVKYEYRKYGENVFYLNGEYTVSELKEIIESSKKRVKMLKESMEQVIVDNQTT